MLTYPTSFPTDAAAALIQAIESGNLTGATQTVCLSAWNVLGFALDLTIGPPATPAPTKTVLDNAAGVAALKSLVTAHAATPGNFGSFDWTALITWLINLIISLLPKATGG